MQIYNLVSTPGSVNNYKECKEGLKILRHNPKVWSKMCSYLI